MTGPSEKSQFFFPSNLKFLISLSYVFKIGHIKPVTIFKLTCDRLFRKIVEIERFAELSVKSIRGKGAVCI